MIDSNANFSDRDAETSAGPSSAQPASFAGAGVDRPVPEIIGRYRVLSLIGQGGMGAVYLAEQESPRRTVALKVIRAGSMSRSLLRRFELEAQVLGRLQHPGIAQIFEAGMFDMGHGAQPFFAMEYVRGRSLAHLAMERSPHTRERLALMVKICNAVHHAHQKGVIHRDLKPGNILVDETGEPKILDFGVARATDADINAATMQTDVGQLVGTIPYMSPEQIAGNPDELDTRSDVYALGVIAYELLAGKLPHNLDRKTIAQAARIIAEDEPTPLSTVNRVLRGDVETIVSKALEKDKTRRYQSAADLAADMQRYLDDQPIVARPPTTMYQLSKFTKRNKALVGGLIAVFVVLVLGIAGTWWKAIEAGHQRDAALLAKQDALRSQQKAEDESKKTHSINDFLVKKMLGAANPNVAQGREVTVKMVLDEAVKQVPTSFVDQPALEASVRGTIAETYLGLGQFAASRQQAQLARDLMEQVNGPDHIDTLTALVNIAVAANYDGKPADAIALLKPALPRIDKAMGPEHRVALIARQVLATSLSDQGNFADSIDLLKQVMDIQLRVQGEDNDDTQVSMSNYAYLLGELGRNADAEPIFRRLYEARLKSLGPVHPRTLSAKSNLAVTLSQLGRREEAVTMLRESAETCEKVLGPDHPDTYDAIANLGSFLTNAGKANEAVTLLERAAAGRKRLLGPGHPTVLDGEVELAAVYRKLGKVDQAIALGEQAVADSRQVNGEDHPQTLSAMQTLVICYYANKDFEKAAELTKAVYAGRQRRLGEDHPDTISSHHNLGAVLLKLKRYDEAEAVFTQALADSKRVNGADHPQTLNTLNMLGALRESQHRPEEAAEFYRQSSQGRARALGPAHPDTLDAMIALIDVLTELRKFDEAETVASASLEACRKEPDSDAVDLIKSAAKMYEAWGKPEKAAQLLSQTQSAASQPSP